MVGALGKLIGDVVIGLAAHNAHPGHHLSDDATIGAADAGAGATSEAESAAALALALWLPPFAFLLLTLGAVGLAFYYRPALHK